MYTDTSEDYNSEVETFHCDECNCEFEEEPTLEGHKEIFHEDGNTCDYCEHETCESEPDRPEKSSESKNENYACDSFDKGDYLQTHIELIHEDKDDKVYQAAAIENNICNKCSLCFSSQEKLKEHKKVMHRSILSF